MKVGLFTVGLPDLTPEAAAEALAKAGYDGVEWRVTHVPDSVRTEPPSFWGNNLCTFEPDLAQAARARDVAAAAGLEVVGLGTYLKVGEVDATAAAMRFAQVAGAPQLRVGVGRNDGRSSYPDLFDRTRAYLDQVQELSAEHGVKALVEIHHRTIIPSASLAARLVAGFDPRHIGVIFDVGNMVREGFEDYRYGMAVLGPYLAHAHVKNAAWDSPEGGGIWQPRWSPLDDGVVDFPGFFAALREAGYDDWVVIEDFSGARPSRESLPHNLAFVRAAASVVAADGAGDAGSAPLTASGVNP